MLLSAQFSGRIHSLLLLSIVQFTTSALPGETCPLPCTCRYDTQGDVGMVYDVKCTDEDLTEIPDLEGLLGVKGPIHISLNDNEIGTVYHDNFHLGLNIVSIDLSQNKDLGLSDDAFNNLATTLKKLMLDVVGLSFAEPLNMLSNLEVLEDLSISHNNRVSQAVENVTVALFQGAVTNSLKTLSMTHCRMKSMSSETLSSLTTLEELDLSNNIFSRIPMGVRKLKKLKKLSLFRGNIDILEDDTFKEMSSLEALDMNTNTLHTIKPHAFRGLENSLKILQLERCRLTEIPTEALQNLKKLKFLDLSQNRFISAPPSSFKGAYCLKELLVSAEGLQFKKDIFSGQEDCIEDLTIKHMKLKEVPLEALTQLNKLTRLSLDHNEISKLRKGAFEGVKASTISLANSDTLSKIEPGAFSGLPPNLHIILKRTRVADIDFLEGYSEGAIETVNMDYAELECRCAMKSSLNVTHITRIYGTCKKGEYTVPLSSSRLEGILDEACAEEAAARNTGVFTRLHVHASFFVVTVNICLMVNAIFSSF